MRRLTASTSRGRSTTAIRGPRPRVPAGHDRDSAAQRRRSAYNYFDERSFQRAFCYQKILTWRPEFADREVSLVFDAAMADAVVSLTVGRSVAHATATRRSRHD